MGQEVCFGRRCEEMQSIVVEKAWWRGVAWQREHAVAAGYMVPTQNLRDESEQEPLVIQQAWF